MVYVRVEAYPAKAAGSGGVAGALVNCWIARDDVEVAVSIARRLIAEYGWYSEEIEEATVCGREEFDGKALE